MTGTSWARRAGHRAPAARTDERSQDVGGGPVRAAPRFDAPLSLALLSLITVAWGVLMGRFGEGAVYVTMGVYALCVLPVIALAFGRVLRALLRPSLRDVALGLGTGLVMTACTYPAYWLASAWFPALPGQVAQLYAESRPDSLAAALPAVIVILGVEELLWRAAWIETLCRYLDPRLAALLSLVLYTAAQLGSGSWIVGLLAASCGALWTLLRIWSGSLWPPLLAHLVWTPVVILLAPLG